MMNDTCSSPSSSSWIQCQYCSSFLNGPTQLNRHTSTCHPQRTRITRKERKVKEPISMTTLKECSILLTELHDDHDHVPPLRPVPLLLQSDNNDDNETAIEEEGGEEAAFSPKISIVDPSLICDEEQEAHGLLYGYGLGEFPDLEIEEVTDQSILSQFASTNNNTGSTSTLLESGDEVDQEEVEEEEDEYVEISEDQIETDEAIPSPSPHIESCPEQQALTSRLPAKESNLSAVRNMTLDMLLDDQTFAEKLRRSKAETTPAAWEKTPLPLPLLSQKPNLNYGTPPPPPPPAFQPFLPSQLPMVNRVLLSGGQTAFNNSPLGLGGYQQQQPQQQIVPILLFATIPTTTHTTGLTGDINNNLLFQPAAGAHQLSNFMFPHPQLQQQTPPPPPPIYDLLHESSKKAVVVEEHHLHQKRFVPILPLPRGRRPSSSSSSSSFECEICGLGFSRLGNFRNHKELHFLPKLNAAGGSRPPLRGTPSPKWPPALTQQFNLHTRLMNGGSGSNMETYAPNHHQVSCQFCRKPFVNAEQLTRHSAFCPHQQQQQRQHNRRGVYHCHFCPLTFTSITSKRRHTTRSHAREDLALRAEEKQRQRLAASAAATQTGRFNQKIIPVTSLIRDVQRRMEEEEEAAEASCAAAEKRRRRRRYSVALAHLTPLVEEETVSEAEAEEEEAYAHSPSPSHTPPNLGTSHVEHQKKDLASLCLNDLLDAPFNVPTASSAANSTIAKFSKSRCELLRSQPFNMQSRTGRLALGRIGATTTTKTGRGQQAVRREQRVQQAPHAPPPPPRIRAMANFECSEESLVIEENPCGPYPAIAMDIKYEI